MFKSVITSYLQSLINTKTFSEIEQELINNNYVLLKEKNRKGFSSAIYVIENRNLKNNFLNSIYICENKNNIIIIGIESSFINFKNDKNLNFVFVSKRPLDDNISIPLNLFSSETYYSENVFTHHYHYLTMKNIPYSYSKKSLASIIDENRLTKFKTRFFNLDNFSYYLISSATNLYSILFSSKYFFLKLIKLIENNFSSFKIDSFDFNIKTIILNKISANIIKDIEKICILNNRELFPPSGNKGQYSKMFVLTNLFHQLIFKRKYVISKYIIPELIKHISLTENNINEMTSFCTEYLYANLIDHLSDNKYILLNKDRYISFNNDSRYNEHNTISLDLSFLNTQKLFFYEISSLYTEKEELYFDDIKIEWNYTLPAGIKFLNSYEPDIFKPIDMVLTF